MLMLGMLVYYKPCEDEGILHGRVAAGHDVYRCPAIVTDIHSETCVNLAVFDRDGVLHARVLVPFVPEDQADVPQCGFCEPHNVALNEIDEAGPSEPPPDDDEGNDAAMDAAEAGNNK